MNTLAINLIPALASRQKSLGISYPTLSGLTSIPVSTLKRILADNSTKASLSNIIAIAQALGLLLTFDETDIDTVRENQARKKARRLVAMVQATSALEGQAVSDKHIEQMIERTVHELLAGSNRKLWAP